MEDNPLPSSVVTHLHRGPTEPPESEREPLKTELALLRMQLSETQAQLRLAQDTIKALNALNARVQCELEQVKRQEARVRQLAYCDPLTGLPNRTLVTDRLDQEVARAQRQGNRQIALLFLDLNGFKDINDTFGHAVGDQLLCAVARRLLECTRTADTVSRYGGDEFVIMLPEIEDLSAVGRVTHKVRKRLAEPYGIDGHELIISASIGAALYPSEARHGAMLIQRADAAMYREKEAARNAEDGSIPAHRYRPDGPDWPGSGPLPVPGKQSF